MFFDIIFEESILEHFVVLDELVIKLGSPLHLGQTEGTWVDGIHHLAVDCACCTLLYLGQLKLKDKPSILAIMYLHLAAHSAILG